MNFGTTKYEHSVLRKYFLKTAVYDRGSISLVFWCPYFDSRFPTVDFQISEMPIDLLGVGTDRLPGRFQLPTPNRSIGPSEVARDCFKAGCFRLPLVGGRFLNIYTAEWSMRVPHLARYRIRQFCEFGLQTSHTCAVIFPPYRVLFPRANS